MAFGQWLSDHPPPSSSCFSRRPMRTGRAAGGNKRHRQHRLLVQGSRRGKSRGAAGGRRQRWSPVTTTFQDSEARPSWKIPGAPGSSSSGSTCSASTMSRWWSPTLEASLACAGARARWGSHEAERADRRHQVPRSVRVLPVRREGRSSRLRPGPRDRSPWLWPAGPGHRRQRSHEDGGEVRVRSESEGLPGVHFVAGDRRPRAGASDLSRLSCTQPDQLPHRTVFLEMPGGVRIELVQHLEVISQH